MKCRFMNGDSSEVEIPMSSTVSQLKQKLVEIKKTKCGCATDADECDSSHLRIIFMGKVLRDDQILAETGLDDFGTVHVVISPATTSTSIPPPPPLPPQPAPSTTLPPPSTSSTTEQPTPIPDMSAMMPNIVAALQQNPQLQHLEILNNILL